jgi:hypothetical protein
MKLALGLICAASVAATMTAFNENATPVPGALTASVNATSINNLMSTFVPLLSYFVLNNSTYNLNLTESVPLLYTFHLDSIHLNTVQGFTTKIFENVPGTNKLHVKLGGIDVDSIVNAELKALYFIPFKSSRVQAKNVTIEFTIASTSDD